MNVVASTPLISRPHRGGRTPPSAHSSFENERLLSGNLDSSRWRFRRKFVVDLCPILVLKTPSKGQQSQHYGSKIDRNPQNYACDAEQILRERQPTWGHPGVGGHSLSFPSARPLRPSYPLPPALSSAKPPVAHMTYISAHWQSKSAPRAV